MADKNRQNGQRKETRAKQQNRRLRLFYQGALLAALTLLVALAFYMPQFMFQVQDGILCGDTVLRERESVNVEALSTSYEKSLNRRMQNFAEGQAANQNFYVTSQDLAPNEELEDFLYGQSGLYNEITAVYFQVGLIPAWLWNNEYSVTQWKRYVIYSDDYAQGVNFILWYIEMRSIEGVVCKFLVDAEDHVLYAVKTEGNETSSGVGGTIYYEQRQLWWEGALEEIWGLYAMYYEAMTEDEVMEVFDLTEGYGLSGGLQYDVLESIARISEPEWHDILGNVGYDREDYGKAGFRLPYGGTHLEIKAQITDFYLAKYRYIYPDILIGVRQIYELIPEFA